MTAARAHVYRVFDAAGRLLYVGSTVALETRLRSHQLNAPWWPFHDRIVPRGFATEKAARAAEAEAIAAEHPRWNRQGISAGHTAPGLDYDRDVQRRLRHLVDEENSLLKQIRKVRMGLAGTRAEAEAIKNGFVLEEDVAS